MRQTGMKRSSRGYVRNLGRLRDGRQPKFYLGHDREEAVRRQKGIACLWQQIEDERPDCPIWDEHRLAAARALAKGESATLPKRDFESPEKYFDRINRTTVESGITVQPANGFLYEVGRQDLLAGIEDYQRRLSPTPSRGHPLTGQTLHQALKAFQKHIEHEYKEVDGSLTDNGKTKIDQIKTMMAYLPDLDLGNLDYQEADEVFGIFRRRPISKRYGTPMARKSCTNYIGELGRFFRWLHLSKEFHWRKPEDFDLINRTPRELDDDVEHESRDTPVWSLTELKIISRYATPIERIIFLLGLNCSYGADQLGRLRVSNLHLADDGPNFIRRIRRKKKTRSIHLLWSQTAAGLRWALRRRPADPQCGDYVFLTESGRPFWSKTKGGNRTQTIPNLWRRLLDRIRRDHPEFRQLPFNSLRDTSANLVRQMAGEEIASLHLAHKHQSKDENLGRYTNPVRKKHFKILRKLEAGLNEVFDAAGKDAWNERPKNYIGLTKIARIEELRDVGVGVSQIARELEISTATVYRYQSNSGNSAIANDHANETTKVAEPSPQPAVAE